MLHSLQLDETAYKEIYRGSTLLLRCSDAMLEQEAFRRQTEYLRQTGIAIIEVFDNVGVHAVLQRCQERIREVMLLNESGGLKRERGGKNETVSLLSNKDIDMLLSQPNVIDDVVRLDLQMALEILYLPKDRGANRVVITGPDGITGEIHRWNGSGTLCFDERALQVSSVTDRERPIVGAAHLHYEKKGAFKQRQAMPGTASNDFILSVDHSPLGGFTLLEYENGWVEIARIWAGALGSGTMSKRLIQAASNEVKACRSSLITVFAISCHEKLGKQFEQDGFQTHKLSQYLAATPLQLLPSYLQTYTLDEAEGKSIYLLEMRPD